MLSGSHERAGSPKVTGVSPHRFPPLPHPRSFEGEVFLAPTRLPRLQLSQAASPLRSPRAPGTCLVCQFPVPIHPPGHSVIIY